MYFMDAKLTLKLNKETIRKAKKYAKENMKPQKEEKHTFIVPFMTGVMSVIAMTILWTVSILVINLVNSIARYGGGAFFGFLILILSVLLSLAILIGVPIYTGSR